MKNKKGLIIILAIAIIAIVVGALYVTSREKEYVIPEGYKLTLQYNMSYVDGPDITYYIYEDKIIAESIRFFPVGAPYATTKTITVYEKISTENIFDVEDIKKLIQNIEGKEVYRENTEYLTSDYK